MEIRADPLHTLTVAKRWCYSGEVRAGVAIGGLAAIFVAACGAFSAIGIVPDNDDPAPSPTDRVDGGSDVAVPDGSAPDDASALDVGVGTDGGCVLGSANDCGECGHSCKGATCNAGLCTPQSVTSVATSPATSLSAANGGVAWVVGGKDGFWCDATLTLPCTPKALSGLNAIERVYLTDKAVAYGSAAPVNTLYRCNASNCASANATFTANNGAVCSADGPDLYCVELAANNTFRVASGANSRTLLAQNGDGAAVASRNAKIYVAIVGKGLVSFTYSGATPADLSGSTPFESGTIDAVVAIGSQACWLKGGVITCGMSVGAKTILAPTGVTALATDATYVYYATSKQLHRIKPDGTGDLLLADLGAATLDGIAPSSDGWLYYASSSGAEHAVRRVAK